MHSIRETVIISAPQQQVWKAWTEPELLAQWYPDRVEGVLASGETVRFIWDCFGLSLDLEVVEMWPPYRLRLRARGADGLVQEQLVTLAGYGNRTRVDVIHSGFAPTPGGIDRMNGTQAGWHTMLRVLTLYAEDYFGQPRRTFAALGPVVAPFEEIFAHYTDRAHIGRWLAERPMMLNGEGKVFAMPMSDGDMLVGRVLSYCEPREVALDVPDFRAVISMRTFALAGGESKLVGIWMSGWSPTSHFDSLQESLTIAVDRLVSALGSSGLPS